MAGHTVSSFYLFLFTLLFSIQLVSTLQCFDCKNCNDLAACNCNKVVTIDSNDFYCTLVRESHSFGKRFDRAFILKNDTSYISDPYFIGVEEKISYDKATQKWSSISDTISYGCHADKCNEYELLTKLPDNGLALMLPIDWLNNNLGRISDKDTSFCRNCPGEAECTNATSFMNESTCPIAVCEGSCEMAERFDTAETTERCYSSFCTDDTSLGPTAQPPQIILRAVYYINTKQFDTIELDVTCNAEDCTSIQLFKDIKEKLQKDLSGIQPFLPQNHGNSIYSTIFITVVMIFVQTFLFY